MAFPAPAPWAELVTRLSQPQRGRTWNPTRSPEKGNKKYLFLAPHCCSLQFPNGSLCPGDTNLFINQENPSSSSRGAPPSFQPSPLLAASTSTLVPLPVLVLAHPLHLSHGAHPSVDPPASSPSRYRAWGPWYHLSCLPAWICRGEGTGYFAHF